MAYQPDRGDCVWIDCDPQAGTEQAGRRPALVLSPIRFNVATGLVVACPITDQVKGGPFEVPMPAGARPTGVVLAEHVKSFDWLVRNVTLIGPAPLEVVDRVSALVCAIVKP
jgi:mRNA interferase MazF